MTAVVPAGEIAGGVDTAVALDDDGLLLTGWLHGAGPGAAVRLGGAAGGGAPIELSYRFRRPDVERALGAPGTGLHGFACLAEGPGVALHTAQLRLEVVGPGGATAAVGIPEPIRDPVRGRAQVLRALELGSPSVDFLARQVYPAIERLRGRIEPGLSVAGAYERGHVPAAAEVSVVVPVYGSLDLLTPQVALLAGDPEFRRAELVFVLDSPELGDEILALTAHLETLYELPMRVVILGQNSGFAHASNVGAGHAGGEHLLFLNSDVFPDRPGWLAAMLAARNGDGGVAAAGPRLLYEDDSLQHAGMYFERDEVTGLWQNLHFHKGMPGTLPAAGEARRVPALTAACLLVGRADFEAIGGFDTAYALGDYEDSDLCIRLQQSGRSCRYEPAATLYHLERSSFTTRHAEEGGSGHVIYNRWLFTHRWDERIGRLMAEFE